MPADRAAELADKLTQGTWTHDHPIGFKEAQELGLPVRSDMPTDFYELMALFPQPTRREPTVQYFPTPYGPPGSPREKEE
jgi:Serine dehydrogenase proteinase